MQELYSNQPTGSPFDEYTSRTKNGPPFKPSEEMKFEVLRLASYVNWPNWALKRPCTLAEDGFYYSGHSDRVVCFCCKIEINNWSVDDKVSERHRSMSPMCEFISGKDTRNVQLVPPETPSRLHCDSPNTDSRLDSGGSTKSVDSGYGDGGSQESLRFPSKPSPSQNPAISMEMSGMQHNSIRDADDLLEELRSLSAVSSSPEPQDQQDHPLSTPREDPDQGTGQIEEVDLQFVKYESYRLRSFEGKWSEDSFVSPAELAKAGFYFVSAPDRVQCAFCKGRLLNWNPTDNPMIEHRRHFSTCPFIKGRNVGNIPIEQSQSSVQVPKSMEKKQEQTPSERLGIMMDKPKHPDYAIEKSRLDSFRTWPKRAIISPAELANAGFFYVGYSDNVKCFFCDGGLRNWDKDDEPWREHAQWFSRCGFLKLKMGEDYVNTVLSETKQTSKGGRKTLPSSKEPVTARRSPPLDPRALKARLDTPMVRTIIDMGFGKELVKKVLDAKLKQDGDDFENAEQLLQAVFEEQETQQASKEEDEQLETGDKGSSGDAASSNKPGISRRKKRNRNKKKKKSDPGMVTEKGAGVSGSVDTDSGEDPAEQQTEVMDTMVQQNEEVQSLVRQYQRIKEERTCKICMDEECTIVFLPCGHLVCCANCAPALRSCPICRTLIKGSVRIYTT